MTNGKDSLCRLLKEGERHVLTVEDAHCLLAKSDCPAFTSFVEFLCNFAGLSFVSYRKTPNTSIRLSVPDKPFLVKYYKELEDWVLWVATPDDSWKSLVMRSDGAIRVFDVTGDMRPEWSLPVALDVRSFLAQEAIIQDYAFGDYVFDWIVVSDQDVAISLAREIGKDVSLVFGDGTIEIWSVDDAFVSLSRGGYLQPPFRLDFFLQVGWKRSRHDLAAFFTARLPALVDPWSGMYRAHPQFPMLRDSGRIHEVPGGGTYRPVHSFRAAAQYGLQQLGWLPAAQEYDLRSDELRKALRDCFEKSRSANAELELYYSAVGMTAFGNVDTIRYVLDYMPLGGRASWHQPLWSAQHIGLIVPFPDCPVEKPRESRLWLEANICKLAWHDELHFYYVRP